MSSSSLATTKIIFLGLLVVIALLSKAAIAETTTDRGIG